MDNLDYFREMLERNKDNILPENFRILKAHFRKITSDGIRDKTIINHYQTLISFGKWCKLPFVSLTEDDMYSYCEALERHTFSVGGKTKKYAPSTIYYYKSFVKRFLKDVNPTASNTLVLKRKNSKKLPEDILTKQDVEALLQVAPSARDRAVVAVFYESGARKGELLGTRIKHVQFDENGAVMTLPDGKTGARRIRLVFSASFLREWLEVHPTKNDRESPIFCSLREPYNIISRTGLSDQLNIIAKKAGITKHIHPHAFRHSRATHLAEHLTEQQMKHYLGWTESSSMAAVYVHLSGKEIDDAILKMNGIKIDETHVDGLTVGRCPRCKEINADRSLYCSKCGMPLTREAFSVEAKAENDIYSFVANDREYLADFISRLNGGDPELIKAMANILKGHATGENESGKKLP